MRPIIVDTDPGIDDAIALLVLHHYCPEAVRLIVASYGNVPLAATKRNALVMRSLLHWDVPVLCGADSPADPNSHYVSATHIHGSDGLAGVSGEVVSELGEAINGDYLQILYNELKNAGCCDYIVLGPLTNLAGLLRRFPDAKQYIGRVVCMGGGIEMGNVTKWAEFNIHCDALSANEVFQSLPDVAVAPLNVTTPVSFSLEEIEQLPDRGTLLSKCMKRILVGSYHSCVGYGEPGATMHDSTAVLYYLFPELFAGRKTALTVDQTDERYGCTTETDGDNIMLVMEGDSRVLLDRIAVCF